MTRYTGLQPQYFPRLHYLARILNTDTYMVRDEVQFVKRHKYPNGKNGPSYQAHSPIKQSSGTYLLQLPVKHEGLQQIRKAKLDNESNWQKDHLKAIQFAYSKAPFFKDIFPEIEQIILSNHTFLSELTIKTVLWGITRIIDQKVDIDHLTIKNTENLLSEKKLFRLKNIKKGSESKALNNDALTANEKIVALMREVRAAEDYCGGTALSAYMDEEFMKKNGITITVQDWKCHEYSQLFPRQGFIPNLSIIDLFMNENPSTIIDIINGNAKKDLSEKTD